MASPYFNLCLSEIRSAEDKEDWDTVLYLLLGIWRFQIPDEERDAIFDRVKYQIHCPNIDNEEDEESGEILGDFYDSPEVKAYLKYMTAFSPWHTIIQSRLTIWTHTVTIPLLFFTDFHEIRLKLEEQHFFTAQVDRFYLTTYRAFFCYLSLQGINCWEDVGPKPNIDEMLKNIIPRIGFEGRTASEIEYDTGQAIAEIYEVFCRFWKGDTNVTLAMCRETWDRFFVKLDPPNPHYFFL